MVELKRYRHLAEAAANRWSVPGMTYDDLLQIGMETIWKLTQKYEELSPALVKTAITNNIVTVLHRVTGFRRQEGSALAEEVSLESVDCELAIPGPEEDVNSFEAMMELLRLLPLRTQNVVLLSAIGYSQVEVAECLSLSEGRVSQLLRDARNRLQSPEARIDAWWIRQYDLHEKYVSKGKGKNDTE